MPRFSHLGSLSVESIQDVIDDLSFLIGGGEILLAVDPHEIVRFCFPIRPWKRDRIWDTDSIADTQIALFDLFYGAKHPPLLLPEYIDELLDFQHVLTHQVGDAYDQAIAVQKFMQSGLVFDANSSEAGAETLVRQLERDFNRVLAAAMGIYRIGTDRLGEVIHEHLDITFVRSLSPEMNEEINAFQEKHKPTTTALKIAAALEPDRDKTGRRPSRYSSEKRRRNNQRDGEAIDRVLSLNRHLGAHAEQKVLVLYVSSAPKTSIAFGVPDVIHGQPTVRGRAQYPLWRSIDQLFAYAITRRDGGDRLARLNAASKKLIELKALRTLEDTISHPHGGGLASRCALCAVHGGSGANCDRRVYCERIAELDAEIWNRQDNLQLVLAASSQLEQYQRLLSKLPERAEERDYVIALRHVLADPNIRNLAEQRIHIIQQLMLNNVPFVSAMPSAFEYAGDLADVLGTRDPVTGAAQALPMRAKIQGDEYGPILRRISEFSHEPPRDRAVAVVRLREAFSEFLAVGARIPERPRDYEMVRCILYMALPGNSGDQLAFAHAREMGVRFPDSAGEFAYLQIWAGRRARRYAEVDSIASAAIVRFGGDARLHHGRSLNTAAWLIDERATDACPYNATEVIRDTEAALALYRASGDGDAEIVAVLLNNLAYSHAIMPGADGYDLTAARAYLKALKMFFAKEYWVPSYPEYLHTEAHIEYQEFVATDDHEGNSIYLRVKLENASRDIGLAVELCPTNTTFGALAKNINAGLVTLRQGS